MEVEQYALYASNVTVVPIERSYMRIYGDFFIGGAVVVFISIFLAIWYAVRRKAPLVSTIPLWCVRFQPGRDARHAHSVDVPSLTLLSPPS
jgi:hypothetical protein